MVDKRMRRRTPVRLKQIRGVAEDLGSWIGHPIELAGFLEQAHFQETDLILVDRVRLAMRIEVGGEMAWYPTLKGISEWQVEKSWVAVDDGAGHAPVYVAVAGVDGGEPALLLPRQSCGTIIMIDLNKTGGSQKGMPALKIM